jgi:hypothetical protein
LCFARNFGLIGCGCHWILRLDAPWGNSRGGGRKRGCRRWPTVVDADVKYMLEQNAMLVGSQVGGGC